VQALLAEALPERRERYAVLLRRIYDLIGGYLGGLILICSINATLTITFLAIIRVPFFLPLGLASGFSSLVPYAGPLVAGASVSLLSAASTASLWKGLACVLYFVIYGQIEGNILGPLIFRRTVHVNPLIVLLSVLFFGELAGIVGAVLAVPVTAALQIVLRELLRERRERLKLAKTGLNTPG
jgi:putative heme transporter